MLRLISFRIKVEVVVQRMIPSFVQCCQCDFHVKFSPSFLLYPERSPFERWYWTPELAAMSPRGTREEYFESRAFQTKDAVYKRPSQISLRVFRRHARSEEQSQCSTGAKETLPLRRVCRLIATIISHPLIEQRCSRCG